MKIQTKHTNRKDHTVDIPNSELVLLIGNEVRKHHKDLPPYGGYDIHFHWDMAGDMKATVIWTEVIK